MSKSEVMRLRTQSKLYDAGYQACLREVLDYLEQAEMVEDIAQDYGHMILLNEIRQEIKEKLK